MDSLVDRFGQIDVLVSNAGSQTTTRVDQLTLEQWRTQIPVQLNGAF